MCATIDYAYFPNQGVLSQLTVMEDGDGIELATVGDEGMVGLPLLWGVTEASSRVVVQVPSTSLRFRADRLTVEISRDTALRRLLLTLQRRLSHAGFARGGLQRFALGATAVLSLVADDA